MYKVVNLVSFDSKFATNLIFWRSDLSTRFPKKLYLIFKLNLGAVHFSMTKMLVLLDSRNMDKSSDT